jgi:hypothetical protein
MLYTTKRTKAMLDSIAFVLFQNIGLLLNFYPAACFAT